MTSPDNAITRRTVLVGAAQAVVGAAVTPRCQPSAGDEPPVKLPKYVIWDAHGHLNSPGESPRERIASLLEVADRMGIERVIVFMGYPWVYDPKPDDLRRQNDQILAAIEHSRGRALGFVYLNPKHTEESLAELDRCIHDGPMVGVKGRCQVMGRRALQREVSGPHRAAGHGVDSSGPPAQLVQDHRKPPR
jgi:hypothetical protein